ncbi:MAG TPA: RNA-binding domain-containing protein [Gelidibacter sp.]|uniref:RNA-binding domain-containing protein n=1 Tax=Gelidibacter sp. TaxID=2018083 RepID=UPI002CC8CBE6|nr:RNA-binding domain-containing protein [Gelidibacter sp.]HTO14439.1 RNA-binding domain-containing protein [Edaphocola sp.]HXJ99235.1 RNA-binding domain-containing protein [Gelidibacter sp.]
MNDNALLHKLLASETETEVLEFKEAKSQFDKNKLGQYFSALSNEANLLGQKVAYLLLGINNDKNIVGTNITEKQLNEYKQEIANNTSPNINFIKVRSVSTVKGNVLIFEIPAAPQGMPIAWKGHYYARNGESLTALNIEKVERIRNQISATDWSAKTIEEATIADLSVEAIKEARTQYQKKNTHLTEEINNWDDVIFLNKAKLTINNKITRTAILLLGKPESEHFISPGTAKISWILKDKDNIEKDYEHFSCPLLLSADKARAKIRNLNYRYLQEGTLFPQEVPQFDPYIIREALNNCIAHQDYTLGGKINIVEREDGVLTFSNSGSFIPQNIERVIQADAPENQYRNPFLANAMVNLNMIDTIGSGIKKMFIIQKNKFFPLPDYTFDNNKVQVQIIGKVVDLDYARKLAELSSLTLPEIIALDKVAKKKHLTDFEIKELKDKKLIEGRKPNFFISSSLATITGEKSDYIKQRGFKDEHYKRMVLDFIKEYGSATRQDIDKLILDILPKVLDKKQKSNKIRNMIYAMSKKDKTIKNQGTVRYPKWVLSSSKTDNVK